MNSEVVWVLVSSESQVQPQKILEPDYLPEYLSVSYDYDFYNHVKKICRKASQENYALSRISNYVDSKQKKLF